MSRLKFGESVYNPADGSWTFPIIEDTTMTDDNLDDVQPDWKPTSPIPGGNPEAGRPEDGRRADMARFNTSRPVEDDVTEDSDKPYVDEARRREALYQAVKLLRTAQNVSPEITVAWAKKFEAYLKGDA